MEKSKLLGLEYSTQFKKDFKRIAKLPISEIIEVGNIISLLQREESLPKRCVDHPLTGSWKGFFERIYHNNP